MQFNTFQIHISALHRMVAVIQGGGYTGLLAVLQGAGYIGCRLYRVAVLQGVNL